MSVTLNRTGQAMPVVGLGLWKISQKDCADSVYEAIKAGYRLLDGASDYGNEVEAGQGLKRAIDEGIVKREDVFVTTKIWNTFHKAEHVAMAARRSLKDWGLSSFDLLLIHFPISLKYVDPAERYPPGWTNPAGETEIEDTPIQETWQAMEKLVDEGLAKNIGISNFMATLIMDLLRYARIKPAVLQVEMHPYHAQLELVEFCKAFDIKITAFSSFGPQSWIELDHPKVKLCSNLLAREDVGAIAKAHGKTPAQILLRWATQRGISVIPKSSNKQRLAENLACTDFDLTQEELGKISALDQGLRFNNPFMIDPRIAIFS